MKTISQAQRWTILQLWTRVCKERGWKSSDRALRLATIGGLIGRELATLDDVERLAECTAVLNGLKVMLGVDLTAALETTEPARNSQRNWRWLIAREVLPALAIYPLEAPMGRAGAEGYLREVLADKSRWRKTDRPESEPALADFDERTTQQIFWTLNARLNSKRKAAGHSGHEMCLAAGVKCRCAQCRRGVSTEAADEEILTVQTEAKTEAFAHVKMLDENTPDWGV